MSSVLRIQTCILQTDSQTKHLGSDEKIHSHCSTFTASPSSYLPSLQRITPSRRFNFAKTRCIPSSSLLRNDFLHNAGDSINGCIAFHFIQSEILAVSTNKKSEIGKFGCSASGKVGQGRYDDVVSREYLIQYYKWLAERKADSMKQLEEFNPDEEEGTISISESKEYNHPQLFLQSKDGLISKDPLLSNSESSQLVKAKEETNLIQSTPTWLKRWEVPWGVQEISIGMVSWIFSFGVSGLFVQFAAHQVGWQPWMTEGADGQALYLLANESVRTLLGLCIVYLVIKPFQPLSPDFFHIGVSRPFSLNSGWLLWSAVGFSCAYTAVQLSAIAMTSFSGHVPTRAEGDALVEVLPIIAFSPMSTLTLVTVTGVCAPVLEETVFRGFLMTSLTKWMPTPVAAFLSACAFAAAHLSPDQFPKLAALGMVLGISYAKTRNLLTPIIIHSIWNSGIILALTFLRLEGQNISNFL